MILGKEGMEKKGLRVNAGKTSHVVQGEQGSG